MSDYQNLYEGMFLFSPAAIGSNVATAKEEVGKLLERANAEVISIFKWDDRRLAYEIKHNKRGVYILAYFKAEGKALTGLERDTNLSELILRSMIVRLDHFGEQELEEMKQMAEKATDTLSTEESASEPKASEADDSDDEDGESEEASASEDSDDNDEASAEADEETAKATE